MNDKINTYRLQKQNLVHKAHMKDYNSLLEKHIGLHSTDYLTPYLSLWARISDFDPSKMFDEINNEKLALRMRAMRGTLFIVHRKNITMIISAIENMTKKRLKGAKKYAPKGFDYNKVKKAIVDLLHKNPNLKFSEIKELLADQIDSTEINFAKSSMELEGIIVRSKQRNITDKLYSYALFEDIFPKLSKKSIGHDAAIQEIFCKYLAIFGPATLDDFRWWLPINKTNITSAIEEMKDVESFILDESYFYMTKEDYNAFESFSFSDNYNSRVIFLPYEDHYPKAFINRNFFIADYMTPHLFGVNHKITKGEIRPSIWLDGKIIGRWEYKWQDKKKTAFDIEIVYLDETIKFSQEVKDEIIAQKESLLQFMNEQIIPLIKTKY